jgi:hypothetical protein
VGFTLPLVMPPDDPDDTQDGEDTEDIEDIEDTKAPAVDPSVADRAWRPPVGLPPPGGDDTAVTSPGRATRGGTGSSVASGS